jgi:hypothetical protein
MRDETAGQRAFRGECSQVTESGVTEPGQLNTSAMTRFDLLWPNAFGLSLHPLAACPVAG